MLTRVRSSPLLLPPPLPAASVADHANLRAEPEVERLMAKHGEPPVVLFSEEVLKINRRGEAVPRVMLVAAKATYLLDPASLRVRRKFLIKSLGALRMSELPDNFLAICNPDEYDVLLVCARKIEAVIAMCDAFRAAREEERGRRMRDAGGGSAAEAPGDDASSDARLPVELASAFTYRAGANVTKRVVFSRTEEGDVDTAIEDVEGGGEGA